MMNRDNHMKLKIRPLGVLLAPLMLGLCASSYAAQTPKSDLDVLMHKFEQGKYSKKGADGCLMCHKKNDKVMALFDGVHGNTQQGPMAGLQCEACHGPQGKHKGKNEPMIAFGDESALDASMQNSVCLACHQDGEQSQWHNSLHDMEEVSCVSCHEVHVAQDPILDKRTQNDTCQSCHQSQAGAAHKRSAHPIASDQMQCTSCHNPHGDIGNAALKQPVLNDNCYQCHADKRGPFLWEHAPVVEDCSICHDAHGSVNDNLLKTRVPMLCKECHSEDGHPSTIPGTNQSIQVAGQGCLNCHTQIHGSNSPKGRALQF
ncbi:DmsE family decaheme c-type cytochrome [Ferrimonas aestuarii]